MNKKIIYILFFVLASTLQITASDKGKEKPADKKDAPKAVKAQSGWRTGWLAQILSCGSGETRRVGRSASRYVTREERPKND